MSYFAYSSFVHISHPEVIINSALPLSNRPDLDMVTRCIRISLCRVIIKGVSF